MAEIIVPVRIMDMPEFKAFMEEANAKVGDLHQRVLEIKVAARRVVEKQDEFLAAPEGAPTLFRSHMLSLAIQEMKELLDAQALGGVAA